MSRVGTKRSDRRWQAPDGTIWPSKFEWEVFDALLRSGRPVRRCDERDTVSYTTRVRSGRCLGCGGSEVVQGRTYTPDIYHGTEGADDGFFLEVKGHMLSSRRSQLGAAIKQHPDRDLRFILKSASTKATPKKRLWEYVESMYKLPCIIWTGELPDEW